MKIIVITDDEIKAQADRLGFTFSFMDEGRLLLLELLCKAASGLYNSCTEELFLSSFNLMKKDRTPTKKGFIFIKSMIYASSNKRPICYDMMKEFRRG